MKGVEKMISEYSKVKTLISKNGYPAGTNGVVVSIYGEGPGCEVELWNENDYPIDVVTYTFDELVLIEISNNAVNNFSWGDWVRCHGQIMFVQDSSDDEPNGKIGLQAENAPRIFDKEMQCQYSKVDYYPVAEIELLPTVIVDETTLRSFFRLEVTPWELAADRKYPFADASGTFDLTDDDLNAFSKNLKNADMLILDAWESQFTSKNQTHVYCEETDLCGFSLAFAWGIIRDRFGWFDIEEDNPEVITCVVDAYNHAKDKPLDQIDISDDIKCDVICRIQDYAKDFTVNEVQRKAYYQYLKQLCEKGDTWALETMAYAYYGGNKILPCNWFQAEYWLLKLYKRGNFSAANSLGYIYYSDRLGEPDYEKAFFYFSKAAEHNIIEAKYKLSDMYRKGHGTRKDEQKAWAILQELYDGQLKTIQEENFGCHYADIALRIGYCFEDGVGTEANRLKAYEYFERARYAIEMRILHSKHFGDDLVKLNIQRALQRISEKVGSESVIIEDLPGWPGDALTKLDSEIDSTLVADVDYLFHCDWSADDFDPDCQENHLDKAYEIRKKYDDSIILRAVAAWMNENCSAPEQYVNFANLFVYYGFYDCKIINPYPFLAILYSSIDWENDSLHAEAAADIFWSISTEMLRNAGLLSGYYDEYDPLKDSFLLKEIKDLFESRT